MRRVLPLVVVAALAVGGVGRAGEPPRPPGGRRPVLAKGDPAPADGLLATVDWARYDVERLRWLTAQRDECVRQLEEGPPPGGWRPVAVVAGVSVAIGFAGGVALAAKAWRR